MSVARQSVRGVVAISLMVQVAREEERRQLGDHDHSYMGLGAILSRLPNIKYSGQQTNIPQLSLATILPSTGEYITYEGSTTYPGCWETVTWILMNKPVYISNQEMKMFHQLSQGSDEIISGDLAAATPLANNLRPRQNLNMRTVRTNIDFKSQEPGCSASGGHILDRQFQANAWVRDVPSADQLSSRYNGFF